MGSPESCILLLGVNVQKLFRTTGVDEGLQETCDGGLSASDIFCSKFERGSRQLLSPTIPTVLTRRSSLPLSAFRCKKKMFSQKERVDNGELTWRRGLYCKEKTLS